MSAAKPIESDKQNTTNLYVNLPAELRIKVIHQFKADFRKSTPLGNLAPFAAVNSEWQHELEAEEELFGSLCLTTNDLPALLAMLSQHRRDCLSKVTFKVWVDNKAINLSEQGDKDTTKLRTQDFIVQSMRRMLETLDQIKFASTHPIKTSKIEFHIRIGIPGTHANYRGLSRQLEWLEGVDCDFSQLLPTNCIRTFLSTGVDLSSQHLSASGPPWSLILSPSSLFTLVSRMPNLEHAMVCIRESRAEGDHIAQQFNICPTLKTLKVAPFDPRPPTTALVRWTTSWSDNIEHLDLRIEHVVDFLRTVSAGGHSTGTTTAWPKLQLLSLTGRYFPVREYYGVAHEDLPPITDLWFWRGGDALTDILGAMAMALASLPCISEIRIKLQALVLPTITIKLYLRNGASKLTVFAEQRSEPWSNSRRLQNQLQPSVLPPNMNQLQLSVRSQNMLPLQHRMLQTKYSLWDLFPEDTIQAAAADVRTAIRTHFGLDLDLVCPNEDGDPESQ